MSIIETPRAFGATVVADTSTAPVGAASGWVSAGAPVGAAFGTLSCANAAGASDGAAIPTTRATTTADSKPLIIFMERNLIGPQSSDYAGRGEKMLRKFTAVLTTIWLSHCFRKERQNFVTNLGRNAFGPS